MNRFFVFNGIVNDPMSGNISVVDTPCFNILASGEKVYESYIIWLRIKIAFSNIFLTAVCLECSSFAGRGPWRTGRPMVSTTSP